MVGLLLRSPLTIIVLEFNFMKNNFRLLFTLLVVFSSFNAQATLSPIEECKKMFANAQYKQGITSCTQAAEAGDAASQTMLGEMFDSVGDSVKTAYWWKKAANAAYQPARNLLALKYFYGGTVLGPEKGWDLDYNKAYKIWIKDANAGVATSQFMIGIMHQQGLGVKKNLSEAYYWMKVSLDNGYKLATDVLIEISRDITPLQKKIGSIKFVDYQKKKHTTK